MKKRLVSLLVVMAMLCAFAPVVVHAETGTKYGDLFYEVKYDDTVTITDCNESATNITIPSKINGKNVTSISFGTFRDCGRLTSVTIPNSVTHISNDAFYECNSLTSINVALNNPNYCSADGILFNKSRTEIIRYPQNKTGTSYKIPDGVTSIGSFCFVDCKKLNIIDIPNTVRDISVYTFVDCDSLTSISIPNGVATISDFTFAGCDSLKSINIPRSVTFIGQRAFYLCNSLSDVYFPGTQKQWESTGISSDNECLTNARIHYNSSVIKYNIYFNLNGGMGYCPSQTVNSGSFVSAPNAPTKSGYIFTGWYANKACSGDPYITSSGVSKRTITNNITLYAGWKDAGIIEWGKDTFKFGNINYFWGNTYIINDEYYNVLTKGLGAYDKYCMNVQKKKSFGGSCYGMSVVMSMLKQGLMIPGFIQSGARNAHDLSYPKNNSRIASIINYYQLSQSIPSINGKLERQSKMGNTYLEKELVNALWNVNNTGMPVVIGYEFKDGKRWSKHAVLAYKVEEEGLYYKVYIADPNKLAHSDPQASSFTIIEDKEPSYMYIDNDWSNIAYSDSSGSYSYTNNTLRLYCVLSSNDLYQSINIQNKINGSSNSASQYSLNSYSLLSADTEEPSAELCVNFDEFTIGNGTQSASVTGEGAEGDLEISEGTSWLGEDMVSYDIAYADKYCVEAVSENEQGYTAEITLSNTNKLFMRGESADKASFEFLSNGTVKASTVATCNKKLCLSDESNEELLGGVDISANTEMLTLKTVSEGKYTVESSSSLKGAVVSVSDTDGQETSVTVEDDVTEFSFTYSLVDDKYVISFEGTNNDDSVTKTNSVIFYSNGGSFVDSLTDVAYGDKISAPEAPEYEGFIFDGWYIDEDYTTEWVFDADTVTENLELYAKWDENTDYYHLVSFNDGDTISQIIVTDGQSLTDEDYPELVEREGYYSEWIKQDLSDISGDVNIYSVTVPENQLVVAELDGEVAYDEDKVSYSLNLTSYTDYVIHTEIVNAKTNVTEQSFDKTVQRSETHLDFEYPFEKDNAKHNIVISFYDNVDDKNTVGDELSFNFVAGILPISAVEPIVPTPSTVAYGTKLSEINLGESWEWADGDIIPTVTNDGYTAYYSVDDENYDWSDIDGYDAENHRVERAISVTVSPAMITGVAISGYSGVADGNDYGVTVTGAEGYTVTYKSDDDTEFTTTVPKFSEGTHAVTVKVSGDNYNDLEETVTVSLAKREQVPNIIVTPYHGIYDGNAHNAVNVSGTENSDTVKYIIDSKEASESIPAITEIGNYSITVIVSREGYSDYTTTVEAIITEQPPEPKETITPVGCYIDKVNIEITVVDGKLQLIITSINNNLPELKLYVAEYNDYGTLKSVVLGANDVSDERTIIETEIPQSGNYKLMLWDNMNTPLIEAIDKIQ